MTLSRSSPTALSLGAPAVSTLLLVGQQPMLSSQILILPVLFLFFVQWIYSVQQSVLDFEGRYFLLLPFFLQNFRLFTSSLSKLPPLPSSIPDRVCGSQFTLYQVLELQKFEREKIFHFEADKHLFTRLSNQI